MPILLCLLVLLLIALLIRRRPGACRVVDWHWRYLSAQFELGLTATVWVLFFVSSLTGRRPFWPGEALSLSVLTVFLGLEVYQWQQARRKAAENPLPSLNPPNLPRHKPPTFLWQATLILLPVLMVTAIGFVALVRDRAAVENEARQRAEELIQQLADTLGRRVATELSKVDGFSYQWLQHQRRSRGGWPGSQERLRWETASANYQSLAAEWQKQLPGIEPEDVLPNGMDFDAADDLVWGAAVGHCPPQPPDWLQSLNPEQLEAWQSLTEADAEGDLSSVSNRVAAFLAPNSPGEAGANAKFLLLRRESRALDAASALAKLRRFGLQDRRMLSGSGLPLGALVFAEMLQRARETGPTPELWRELENQVQSFPNFLTPLLLNQAESLVSTNQVLRDGVAAWRSLWHGGERVRGVAEASQSSGKLRGITTTNLWVEYNGSDWFCIMKPGEIRNSTNANGIAVWFTNAITSSRFYSRRLMEQALANALRDPKPLKPEYFGYSVELEGKPLTLPLLRGIPAMSLPADSLAVGRFQIWQPGELLLRDPQPGQPPERGPQFETLPGHPTFVLRVHLADRARLLAAYRQRLLLFGGLIVVSAAVAVVGVVISRRAFLREQRLSEMKSDFVSSVSHELRAPVASVRLMAESLERGKVSEPAKKNEYFRFMGQECRRLSSLIENVLDFSRIEQGRKQYEFEPTDLAALIRESVKLMEPGAAEKGVQLKSEIRNPKSEIEVDGRAIQQALVNLMDNAIKHSPKGETVTVGVEMRSPKCEVRSADAAHGTQDVSSVQHPASGIALFVSDHGPGIPACEHEKIFERFYRRGSELRRETQGVGIGLSIVKHIVEAHGGCVRVESEVGKGCRFTIELPGDRPETRNTKLE